MVRLGDEPLVHDTAAVIDCRLGRYTQIGECLAVQISFSFDGFFAPIPQPRISHTRRMKA
jgi:hypothetical protein